MSWNPHENPYVASCVHPSRAPGLYGSDSKSFSAPSADEAVALLIDWFHRARICPRSAHLSVYNGGEPGQHLTDLSAVKFSDVRGKGVQKIESRMRELTANATQLEIS